MYCIHSMAQTVTAHMCTKYVYDDYWQYDDDGDYDSYRAKPMPTIDDLNKFEPSTMRAFCKYIIQYNILNERIGGIIAQIITDVSSPITHEFIVDFSRGDHRFNAYFNNVFIYLEIENLNGRMIFYILKKCHLFYNRDDYDKFDIDPSGKIDFEFTKKLIKLLILGPHDDAYALMAEQFK